MKENQIERDIQTIKENIKKISENLKILSLTSDVIKDLSNIVHNLRYDKVLTKEEFRERFNNIKVYVGNPTLSNFVQRKLIKAGISWRGSECPSWLSAPVIYVIDYNLYWEDDWDDYINSELRSVTVKEILTTVMKVDEDDD